MRLPGNKAIDTMYNALSQTLSSKKRGRWKKERRKVADLWCFILAELAVPKDILTLEN